MKSTPFFAGIGLAALLSSCSVYHSAPIDLNAEEASWKEASRVDSPTSITQNQARQIGLVMNPDLNKARLKLASSNEVARQSGWWNDPSFSWDIEQVLQENTVNMSGSLGFTIPVTGLPALEKKVAEQYKEADFWTLRQAELDFLSSLDQAWSKLAVTQRRKTVIRERLDAIRRENGMIEQLIGAGEVDFSSRQVASQRMNDAIRELQTVTEKEVGGEIGFNLPLWNRNRKAIAEARGTRDLSRQETIQLWKTELFNARQLDASQQMALRHCRTELQRMESFAASVRTMEKLHGIGEASLLELAENRHQLYESRLAFLDNLDKLLTVQAQLRYLTYANL